MEAMATGLPVISTYHGGIPEIVKDNVSGFLVPERNVEMLLEKMIYLIENPESWISMGKAGAEWVKQEHNKDMAINKTIDIFFSLLKEKKLT
ncbi:MAG: glycosyltransferase, partial [Candidatus Babeliales bacterium]